MAASDDSGPKIEEISDDEPEQPTKLADEAVADSASSGLKTDDISAEELEERLGRARAKKEEGNALFREKNFDEALALYSEAIEETPVDHKERAVFLNNRAACLFTQGLYKDCIPDCTEALKLDEKYVKCLVRRAQAREALKEIADAFDDFAAVLKLEPANPVAVGGAARLEAPAREQREREKEEMMGKLKEVGNQFLGLFGMSVDNFKAEKDPVTGNYSISMNK
mmetsp:Transcript_65985/g.155866  ORF Transcript_65985/g.155866 Transcript_65985/m.155866 type:complete len:225 (-) Transcript_65985:85-759(-)